MRPNIIFSNQTLPAPIASKIDALVFTQPLSPYSSPRLFSSSGGTELLEWDLTTGRIKRSLSSQGGAIWALAASPLGTTLAIGCEDGFIRIISLLDNDFIHKRRLARVQTRILSLAFGPPKRKSQQNGISRNISDETASASSDDESDSEDIEDLWQNSFIVGGCADSSARKWDLTTGRVLERMTVDRVRKEKTLVWTVGVLG